MNKIEFQCSGQEKGKRQQVDSYLKHKKKNELCSRCWIAMQKCAVIRIIQSNVACLLPWKTSHVREQIFNAKRNRLTYSSYTVASDEKLVKPLQTTSSVSIVYFIYSIIIILLYYIVLLYYYIIVYLFIILYCIVYSGSIVNFILLYYHTTIQRCIK